MKRLHKSETPVSELTDQQIQGRLADFELHGHAYEGDDEAHKALREEHKRRGLPHLCPNCDCEDIHHRDAIRELPNGDEIDVMECPPEECREGDALEHWSMFGCEEACPAIDAESQGVYCANCGNDVPQAVAVAYVRSLEAFR